MKLIDDAAVIWTKLWSVRLGIASGLGSSIDTAYQIYISSPNKITLAISIVVALTSFGGVIARLIHQPSLAAAAPVEQ